MKIFSNKQRSAVTRTVIITIMVILFFVGIFTVYYSMLYSEKRSNIVKDGEISAIRTSAQLNDYLSVGTDAIMITANMLDDMIRERRTSDEILKYLTSQSTAVVNTIKGNSAGMYGCICGDYLDGSGWEPPADYVATERPWYIQAIGNSGRVTVTEPYLDAMTGTVMVTLAKTLCDGKSVVAFDMSLDGIQTIAEEAADSEYADIVFITDRNGYVVAHSDKNEIGKDYGAENDSLGQYIFDEIYNVDKEAFEFDYNDSHYIIYSAAIMNDWHCISVKDTTYIFGSLNMILVLTICVVIAMSMIISLIMIVSGRRSRIAQRLYAQLSSTADIYISMHEINFRNDTFSEVRNNKAEASAMIGETRNHCQQMIRDIMERFSDPSTRSGILDFVDFSKLNDRLKDTNTITTEFLSADKKWRKARYIVSERNDDGTVARAMYLVEDIDAEKRERDMTLEAVKLMNEQISSVANIYFTMYDIDIPNDTFTEIKTNVGDVSELVGSSTGNAHEVLEDVTRKLSHKSSRRNVREFVDLSTLDERLKDKNTLTVEFLSYNEVWCRGRFVVSKRTPDGSIDHVIWLVEGIDEEKRNRDAISETARNLNTQMASISNIYMTVFDIDLFEDTFSVIKSENAVVNSNIKDQRDNAQILMYESMERMTAESSMDDVMNFINFGTLDRRLRDTETVALELFTKTGIWVRVRFMVSQRKPNGKVSHVLWLAENIDAEKKERDKLIDMSERALAASEAKSSFLSNMSHEIRTPINAVLGMNEMILRECSDSSILGYSESIRTAGNTLLGLVNDILDFSKIEAGKMEIIPVDYDLSSMINDLVNMIHTRAEDKGLQLILDINRNVPRMLHGDEVRIKQVITNILTNAVKYTEKGSVTFVIDFMRISGDDNGITLHIEVKDTGIGIKKEDMRKLFSEFDRIDEERNRQVEGTGLGMSITKRLLEMMDSSLEVESIYELGSKFSFDLKQKVVKWEQLGDYEAAYKASLGKRRKYRELFRAPDAQVLVVDDTPMNLMVFRSLLKQTAVKIDTANSGDEGLALAYDKKYDIIFFDHMMPEKDGIETLHEMRARENDPNRDTPVICLTANAISGAREQYLAEGFDDYLTKPIDPAKLESMLLNYLPESKVMTADDSGNIPEETASESVIPSFVAGIYEIDTAAGIMNSGSEEAYLETLKTYAGMIGAHADETERYWLAGDVKNATIKIHAMKSTSRIIGAADIGELAQKLESAGNAGDTATIEERLGELLTRCRKLGEQLSPLLGDRQEEEDDSGKPPISPDELSEAYALIKESLETAQFDNINEIAASLKDYRIPDEEKDRVKKIAAAVGNLDYDKLPEIIG